MKYVAQILTVAALASSSVEGASLRDAVQQELEVSANDPVCYEILDLWWGLRVSQKTRADITTLDTLCDQWTNNEELCMHKSKRTGTFSDEEKNAACTMVGAHNKRCLANPCNHLNTGDCTVQATGGVCFWFTKDDMKINNEYWQNKIDEARAAGDNDQADDWENEMILPRHGCYRNRCNQAGLGKNPKKDCNSGDFDTPGIYSCTWCAGANDPLLKGQGMGCQATTVTTASECAPVNNDSVPKSTIFMQETQNRCQCSNDYSLCEEIISSRSGYVPRF